MRVLNLNCNDCGAPLVVPRQTNYLTCEFCGTQLHVVREGGAAYTEIQELAERTGRLENDVAHLKRTDEIERLDRAWEREMETYKVSHGKGEEASIPTRTGALFGMGFVAVFGVIWTFFAMSMGGGGFALFGVLFVGFAIVNGFYLAGKAEEYERRRREYLAERRRLMDDGS